MKKTLKTKLRIRFVLLAMLGLLLVQSVIVGMSIYHNYQDLVTKSDMLISQLYSNPSGASRYFSVKIPNGMDIVYPDAVQNVSITAEDATSFAQRVLAKEQEKGFVDGYRYHVYRNENGTKIYFLFRESSMEMCKTAAENMILISLIGLVAIGGLLIPVSGWVVKPLVDNHSKQKQFITAASHELKTPLTVINTNAQLLESEIGQNDWLDGIQKQITHLTQMTHDLVTLSKAEEYDNPLLRESFSFSGVLRDMVETYAVIAKQNSVRIDCAVGDEIMYSGSKDEVQQLMGILLDNACKYCPQSGCIQVKARHSFHGVRLCVVNTAQPLAGESAETLVQRFRRGQNASGQTGFGLGLSIAEAIANRHNGHLAVSTTKKGEFCVEVVLH